VEERERFLDAGVCHSWKTLAAACGSSTWNSDRIPARNTCIYLPRIAGSDLDVFHAREFSKILDFGEPSMWKILRVICQTGE